MLLRTFIAGCALLAFLVAGATAANSNHVAGKLSGVHHGTVVKTYGKNVVTFNFDQRGHLVSATQTGPNEANPTTLTIVAPHHFGCVYEWVYLCDYLTDTCYYVWEYVCS